MKKFVKAILAVSTCMPLLAFSACNGLPEVSDAEKPAVFANYSEKYAAALETATQGDLYLNQYFSVRMQAVNGDTKLDATVLGEANYDIVGGELTRQTSEMTEKNNDDRRRNGRKRRDDRKILFYRGRGLYVYEPNSRR
ncbi:MAG: hypothetical protein IJX98_07280 [Clostridia bacterium]|nr:hypothetical protein [Clostridia bacterium]